MKENKIGSEYRDIYNREEKIEDVLELEVYNAWKLKVLDKEVFEALPERSKLEYLCAYGLLAPTTHNTVPQKYRVVDGGVELFLDRDWVLGGSDPEGRQACVSMGCVVESMVLAASAYGRSLVFNQVGVDENMVKPAESGSENLALLGELTLEDGDEFDAGVLKAMLERKMHRGEYDRSIFPEDIEARLVQIAHDYGMELAVVKSGMVKIGLARFQERAMMTAISDPRFGGELGEWFLLNEDVESERGMRGHEFGKDAKATKVLKEGMLDPTKMLPHERAGFAAGEKRGMENASAVMAILSDGQGVEQWVQAGRLYQRLAVELMQEGYFNSMHAALTEVGFGPIAIANKMFRTTVLRTRKDLLVLFRVGKLKDERELSRPHASRPTLGSLFV